MTQISKIISWIITHKRASIVLFLLVIAVLSVYSFLSSNAVIVVTPGESSLNMKITTFASTDAGTDKIGGSGLMFVARNTKSLIVTTDDERKTQIPLDIPWFGYLEVKVNFVMDKNADKIAFDSIFSPTCVTYSTRLRSLLAYQCSSPSALMQYQTPKSSTWRNIAVASSLYYPNSTAKPYNGGLLGIAPTQADSPELTTSPLVFTNDSGQTLYYKPPDDLGNDSFDRAVVYTNPRNPKDTRFVLVSGDGSVYLATPTGSQGAVKYSKFSPSVETYSEVPHETICRIAGDDVFCYQGRIQAGFKTSKKTDDVISHYSFEKGHVDSVSVGQSLSLENLFVTNDGKIYGKQYKKLLRFTKTNDRYRTTEIAQNIDSGSASDTSMYYVQNGDVYLVNDTNAAHLVFHSDNIMVKTVFVADNQVFLLGMVNNSNDKSLQGYVINNEDNTSPGKRIIDLLPVASGQLPYTVSQKLVGNTLQVGLVVTIAKIPGDDNTPVSVIDERKQAVLNALKNQGIDTNHLTVQFTY